MKGTMRRDPDAATDALLKTQLASSEKERSENVMIVDLVRNDLSRVAKRGTVQVEELFDVYTFPSVHQMISTIRCEVDHAVSFTDVVRALFPMGSMTGAPKISAMNIIEELEGFRRSLYSGTVGYIDPSGDFDFNVVIRSLLCNTHTGLVTAAAGGAITAGSDPEQEFAETELKMKPLLHMLGIDPAAADITDRHAERI
jgi:para-aminobenzoate synthetase component 1